MGFFEKLELWLSPRRAYEREAWRLGYEELKSYDGASGGRLNAAWRAVNASAQATDKYSRDTLRARARDLERNSDIAQSVIKAYRRNVVGQGFVPEALTGDAELNEKIESCWKEWCKAKNCDVNGTQSFNQLLRMAVTRKKVDGGILIVKRYVKGASPVPLRLQCFEVDELDTTAVTPKHKGDTVVDGVELDKYRKPVGYFIKQYDLEGNVTVEPFFINANDVIFYFTKDRPSQLREISDMATTITRVRDINEFVTAVSVKERIAACLSVFIKKALPASGIGRTQPVKGEGGQISYEGKSLTPGMIRELNAGDEIQVVNPGGNSAEATEFLRMQYRLISAGQGISYEAASRDMSGVNYSSARQAIIEDEITYFEEIELLKDKLLDEVYESFVVSGFLSGLFNIPDFWAYKKEYLRHTWVSPPKKWIDPIKEANATAIALKTGQKTYKQIAAENGKDWRDQINDISEVAAYAREKGLMMGGDGIYEAGEAE